MTVLLVASLGLLAYVYVGYPVLLRLLVRVRGQRPVRRTDVTPTVSLVISAFNEEAVIGRKLDNVLALDYPRARLQVVVVSDASTDATDRIVTGYASRGVEVVRQPARAGKTVGLNRVVPTLTGEIVVFSDANAMYEPAALRMLVRNFADPEVGCVTGEARYASGESGAAGRGERVYWDYEIQLKRLETALGSMVGGDGAIYAIRRSLWRELPADAINDFLNPLQIVAAGHRAIYEPEAVCHEDMAGSARSEYRRRVRIVSRSWRAVFQAREVLNPFRHGLFTWSVVSHKMLRWFSGLLAALALVAATPWLLSTGRLGLPMWALMLGGAVVLTMTAPGRRLVSMLGYFTVVHAASLVGVARGTVGRVSGVWTTPRAREAAVASHRLVPVGPLLLWAVALTAVVGASAVVLAPGGRALAVVFWGSLAVLGYVYAGYPALLAVLRAVRRRPVRRDAIEPTVCLFIAANDEAGVIEAKLRNTLALDYPADRLEVVVASDGSLDGTNEMARKFAPRVRLLEYSPRRGKVAVIKDGLAEVTSEIVIFSDANTFLEPDAVRALVRNFADEEVGAVSGDVALVGERAALAWSEDLYYRYERWIQRAESEVGSMIGADGALYAVRRGLFVPPAGDVILDDLVIPMAVVRQGRRVVFEPGARAREQGSESAWEEFSRKSRVTAGAVQFLKRADSAVPASAPQVVVSLLSHKALRWLSPAFAACAFLASVALADASRGYALAAVGQGALCLVGLAGCVPILRRPSPIAIAHYFCLVQAAAAVGLWRGLIGRQSVLWERFVRVEGSRP